MECGMNELRSQLSQRDEHKATLMESRMRQCQKLSVAGLISVKKKIQVNCARAHGYLTRPSEQVFYSQQTRHKLFGTRKRIAAQFGNHVEKSGLAESFHWLGLVDRRKSNYLETCVHHAADAEQQVAASVTEVGAESDVCIHVWGV